MSSIALESNQFRIYSAQKFLEALFQTQLSKNNLYCYIGKTTPWTNDASPTQPNDTVESRIATFYDMLAIKKISPSDVSLVIPRYNWTSGTAYAQYNSLGMATGGISYDLFEPALSAAPFFVYTTDNNVYKCLSNNNGINSSVMPTGTGTTPITTGDGYIWKFMFQVSANNILKFLSPNWIPTSTLTSNDGSLQWAVQTTAVKGSIEVIQMTNGGSGYTTVPSVSIAGDGTGCTATANITTGAVTSITITNKGTGYSRAVVTFGGPGTNAAAHAMISPPGGHGSDPVNELGAMYVIVDIEFNYDESGKITISNDFRKFGLLLNPFAYGLTVPYTALVGSLTTNITLSGVTGTYSVDNVITGSTSHATAYVVDYNAGVLRAIQINGTFVPTETLTATAGTATIVSVGTPDIQPNTGLILTTEHMAPVTRNTIQIEEIKIVLPF